MNTYDIETITKLIESTPIKLLKNYEQIILNGESIMQIRERYQSAQKKAKKLKNWCDLVQGATPLILACALFASIGRIGIKDPITFGVVILFVMIGGGVLIRIISQKASDQEKLVLNLESQLSQFKADGLALDPLRGGFVYAQPRRPESILSQLVAFASEICRKEHEMQAVRLNLEVSDWSVSNTYWELEFVRRQFQDLWNAAGKFAAIDKSKEQVFLLGLTKYEESKTHITG